MLLRCVLLYFDEIIFFLTKDDICDIIISTENNRTVCVFLIFFDRSYVFLKGEYDNAW